MACAGNGYSGPQEVKRLGPVGLHVVQWVANNRAFDSIAPDRLPGMVSIPLCLVVLGVPMQTLWNGVKTSDP